MASSYKYYLILQANVLLWGLTGILGDYIVFEDAEGTISSTKIVFYRTAIASVSLFMIGLFLKQAKVPISAILKFLAVGIIIAFHWYAFFYSIKVSNVSVAVVCMSMMAFFTALLEPVVRRRKIYLSEIVLGVASVVGMSVIFSFESSYTEGIIWGLVCSFLAAVFSIINAQLTQKYPTVAISKYEMLGAMLTSSVLLIYLGGFDMALLENPTSNWIYILILGLVCTTAAFLIGVWVIRYVSPFSFSISLNLEPVYTILIVAIIGYFTGDNKETMTTEFYIGGGIIILAVFADAILKRNKLRF